MSMSFIITTYSKVFDTTAWLLRVSPDNPDWRQVLLCSYIVLGTLALSLWAILEDGVGIVHVGDLIQIGAGVFYFGRYGFSSKTWGRFAAVSAITLLSMLPLLLVDLLYWIALGQSVPGLILAWELSLAALFGLLLWWNLFRRIPSNPEEHRLAVDRNAR